MELRSRTHPIRFTALSPTPKAVARLVLLLSEGKENRVEARRDLGAKTTVVGFAALVLVGCGLEALSRDRLRILSCDASGHSQQAWICGGDPGRIAAREQCAFDRRRPDLALVPPSRPDGIRQFLSRLPGIG